MATHRGCVTDANRAPRTHHDAAARVPRTGPLHQPEAARPADGAGRTAHGLFVADGFKATADAKLQFEALGDDENDAAKLFEGVDTSTDGEPPESDAEHEKELDAALAAAYGGEDKYHAALARLQEEAEDAPDVEIPPEQSAEGAASAGSQPSTTS